MPQVSLKKLSPEEKRTRWRIIICLWGFLLLLALTFGLLSETHGLGSFGENRPFREQNKIDFLGLVYYVIWGLGLLAVAWALFVIQSLYDNWAYFKSRRGWHPGYDGVPFTAVGILVGLGGFLLLVAAIGKSFYQPA
jgi:hypothetical protein